jgi:hypothetical protein
MKTLRKILKLMFVAWAVSYWVIGWGTGVVSLDLFIIMFFMGMALFVYSNKHFFITLMRLEFLMLLVLWMLMAGMNMVMIYLGAYYVYLVVLFVKQQWGEDCWWVYHGFGEMRVVKFSCQMPE